MSRGIYTKKDIELKIKEKSEGTVILIGEYKNTNTKVELKCLTCNHIWEVTPRSYFQNKTICPNCNSPRGGKLSQKEIKSRILKILGSEYSLVGLYTGKKDKIKLRHICGHEYEVWPNDIWQKHLGECLECKGNISKGHRTIKKYLDLNGLKYEEEKKFDSCLGITGIQLPFDFYVPFFNLLIEFDGEQHFIPKWSIEEFERTQRNDKIKNSFAKENNIKLIRIPFNKIKEIESILEETFNDYRKHD